MTTIGTFEMWASFAAFVVVAIAVDLFLLKTQGAHRVSTREALAWSVVWVGLAAVFCLGLWVYLDQEHGRAIANQKAGEFITGYLIEKSLSIDNVFVFLTLFGYFAIPAELQKRAIILGILGAIVLRVLMILIGGLLIARFHWILYVFGLFLLITGVKMMWFADSQGDFDRNPVLAFMRRHLRLTPQHHGEQLSVEIDGRRWFTPMFAVLVLIGITDVIFAVDSIPAVFAVTEDPFIVMSANVFAILGLRALYFLLADLKDRFHLLSYGLALVLMVVGAKMLLAPWITLPTLLSLALVGVILATSMILSWRLPKPRQAAPSDA
jgi:tellurite resistance protein TerC